MRSATPSNRRRRPHLLGTDAAATPAESPTVAQPANAQPANPTAVPEPATTPELPGEQPSSGETAA